MTAPEFYFGRSRKLLLYLYINCPSNVHMGLAQSEVCHLCISCVAYRFYELLFKFPRVRYCITVQFRITGHEDFFLVAIITREMNRNCFFQIYIQHDSNEITLQIV